MILFQCPNQVGLGHMSRLAAIAVAMRELDPQVRLPFVVEGTSHSVLESYGLPYLSLPGPRDLRLLWNQWPEGELKQLALSIFLAIVRNLGPEIVVFNCLPSPPFVSAAVECGLPIVLCLRKMREFDKYFEQMRQVLPLLSLVLVPHDPGEFDVPEVIQGKTVFVGQIVRPDVRSEPSRSGVAGESLVVISAGGGGYSDTADFFNMAIRAITRIRGKSPSVRALLVTGPLFSGWERLELAEGIRVFPFVPI